MVYVCIKKNKYMDFWIYDSVKSNTIGKTFILRYKSGKKIKNKIKVVKKMFKVIMRTWGIKVTLTCREFTYFDWYVYQHDAINKVWEYLKDLIINVL